MKKIIVTVILITCITEFSIGQELYFKPNLKYHLPLTTQNAPEYFTAEILLPQGTSFTNYIPISTEINKFSLAKGLSYGVVVGYSFSEFFRMEIGIDYFKNNETIKTDNIMNLQATTGWKFKTINSTPTFVIGKYYYKSTFSAKFGLIVGLSSLEKTISLDTSNKTYEFNNTFCKGYMFAIEYSFNFNRFLSLTTEFGIDNLFYTPKQATLKENDFNPFAVSPTNVNEIEYVDKIDNERVYYNSYYKNYYTNRDEPSKRLSETLKLNSIYVGIGLIYKINSNEKN